MPRTAATAISRKLHVRNGAAGLRPATIFSSLHDDLVADAVDSFADLAADRATDGRAPDDEGRDDRAHHEDDADVFDSALTWFTAGLHASVGACNESGDGQLRCTGPRVQGVQHVPPNK